jgi:hypothetical protein
MPRRIAHHAPVLMELRALRVIASEAKQSIYQLVEAWIASSLALLAMTGLYWIQTSNSETTHVRNLAARCARALRRFHPPKQQGRRRPSRAQGRSGARCTRGLACKGSKKTHTTIQVQRRQSSLPCAMVLRLISCFPRRDRAFLSPSSLRSVSFSRT